MLRFQISKGIGAAHELGIIHRDVKPHNILLSHRGNCKVIDFGIALIRRDDGSPDIPDVRTLQTQNAMGTLGYMAPEQRTNPLSADVRTDVYGIGATLYTLLTGQVVTNLFIAEREPELLDGIPEPLADVLMRATAYRMEQRYASVADLSRALYDMRSLLPEDPATTPALVDEHVEEPEPPRLDAPSDAPRLSAASIASHVESGGSSSAIAVGSSSAASAAPSLPPSASFPPSSSLPPSALNNSLSPRPLSRPTPIRPPLRIEARTRKSDGAPPPNRTRPLVVLAALAGLGLGIVVLDMAYVNAYRMTAGDARTEFVRELQRGSFLIDQTKTPGAFAEAIAEIRRSPGPKKSLHLATSLMKKLRAAYPKVDDGITERSAVLAGQLADLDLRVDHLRDRVEDWESASRTTGLSVGLGFAPAPY